MLLEVIGLQKMATLCRTKPVSLRFRGGESGVDGLVTPPQSYDQLSIDERR